MVVKSVKYAKRYMKFLSMNPTEREQNVIIYSYATFEYQKNAHN